MSKIAVNNQIYSKFIKPENNNISGSNTVVNENKNTTTKETRNVDFYEKIADNFFDKICFLTWFFKKYGV